MSLERVQLQTISSKDQYGGYEIFGQFAVNLV